MPYIWHPVSYDYYMSRKKLAQLVVPIGTATHRLRKLLLFHLACELKLNYCHRCLQTIGSPDDLGIDHKEPWLDASIERFWDLGNVAFSHKLCNTRAGILRSVESLARARSKGRSAWHGLVRQVQRVPATTSFNRNKWKWNGLQSFCSPVGVPSWPGEGQSAGCPYRDSERVGFEPTERFHVQRFSRPPHSTTLPPLHVPGTPYFTGIFARPISPHTAGGCTLAAVGRSSGPRRRSFRTYRSGGLDLP